MRVSLLLFCGTLGLEAFELSAVEIVRRACELETANLELRRQYTYRESTRQRETRKDGKRGEDKRTVHDVFYIGGEEYRRLVEKDGRLLSGKDAAREQDRLDRQIQKRKNEDPSVAQRRAAKEIREAQEFRSQVPEAFTFRLVGEEEVAGRTCYRIHADPKIGFRPKGDAKFFTKVKGDMWVDKSSFKWARVEAETIDTVTAIGGLVRLAPGTTIDVRQAFINGEVWFPDLIKVRAKARALLFFSAAIDMEILYSDFKKFTVDSKVMVAEQ
jgi:DNA-binding helix-hairpin-helix protein with protein kinase domain